MRRLIRMQTEVTQIHDVVHLGKYFRSMSEPKITPTWLSADMATALAALFALSGEAVVQVADSLSEHAAPARVMCELLRNGVDPMSARGWSKPWEHCAISVRDTATPVDSMRIWLHPIRTARKIRLATLPRILEHASQSLSNVHQSFDVEAPWAEFASSHRDHDVLRECPRSKARALARFAVRVRFWVSRDDRTASGNSTYPT
jgi:hypothetical protein